MFPENVVEVRRIPLWGPVVRRRSAPSPGPSIRPAMEPFLMSIATNDADGSFRPSLEDASQSMLVTAGLPTHSAATMQSS